MTTNNPVTDRAREAAQSILWVKTLIDDREAIEQAFQRVIDETKRDILAADRVRDARNAALKEAANIVGPKSGGQYSWLANRIRQRIEGGTPASDSPAIPAGMKPWHGGDSAPEDWDGGAVLLRGGVIGRAGVGDNKLCWKHPHMNVAGVKELGGDIIAYTLKPTPASHTALSDLEALVAVCEKEFTSELTETDGDPDDGPWRDEDDEAVSHGLAEDGETVVPGNITFGHIRRARAAIAALANNGGSDAK